MDVGALQLYGWQPQLQKRLRKLAATAAATLATAALTTTAIPSSSFATTTLAAASHPPPSPAATASTLLRSDRPLQPVSRLGEEFLVGVQHQVSNIPLLSEEAVQDDDRGDIRTLPDACSLRFWLGQPPSAVCSTKSEEFSTESEEFTLDTDTITAQELHFRPGPPYDVIAPKDALDRIGPSLRVARSLIPNETLAQLQNEVHMLPRSLPWGSDTDKTLHISRRAFLFCDGDAMRGVSMGVDGISDWKHFKEANERAAKAAEHHTALKPELARWMHKLMCLEPSNFRGLNVNFQHGDYPFHKDLHEGDGFGRDIVTANVRGDGVVIIEEPACRERGAKKKRTRPTHWFFRLSPGDVWAMPGEDNGYNYVRWHCRHGLPHQEIKTACKPGCSECRVSINFRYGRVEDEEGIDSGRWLKSQEPKE